MKTIPHLISIQPKVVDRSTTTPHVISKMVAIQCLATVVVVIVVFDAAAYSTNVIT